MKKQVVTGCLCLGQTGWWWGMGAEGDEWAEIVSLPNHPEKGQQVHPSNLSEQL